MSPVICCVAANVLELANCGTFDVSTFRVVVPPNDTEPPPVRSVPAATVNDGCCNIAFVTPAVAMLGDPLVVIGRPVNPAPLPALVTVPATANVCPDANVKIPALLSFNPVSTGAPGSTPNRDSALQKGCWCHFVWAQPATENAAACTFAVLLLYDEASRFIGLELNPLAAVANPVVAISNRPRTNSLPFISKVSSGFVTPKPILLPDWKKTELPRVVPLGVHSGI